MAGVGGASGPPSNEPSSNVAEGGGFGWSGARARVRGISLSAINTVNEVRRVKMAQENQGQLAEPADIQKIGIASL